MVASRECRRNGIGFSHGLGSIAKFLTVSDPFPFRFTHVPVESPDGDSTYTTQPEAASRSTSEGGVWQSGRQYRRYWPPGQTTNTGSLAGAVTNL